MLSQMRDVLEKDNFMPERYVIEQNEMLMKLPHIPNMGYHRDIKLPAEQADGNDLSATTQLHLRDNTRFHFGLATKV